MRTLPSAPTLAKISALFPANVTSYTSLSWAISWVFAWFVSTFQTVHVVSIELVTINAGSYVFQSNEVNGAQKFALVYSRVTVQIKEDGIVKAVVLRLIDECRILVRNISAK